MESLRLGNNYAMWYNIGREECSGSEFGPQGGVEESQIQLPREEAASHVGERLRP